MANLGNSIINGRLRVINETNTGTLTVNGSNVSLLSGNIKDNTTSTAIVSAKQVADYINSQAATPKFDGGDISGGGLTAGAGSASAVGNGITLGTATTTKPSSGYYITVTGSGTVSRAAITTSDVLYNGAVNGWVNIADNTKVLDGKSSAATSASSNTATVYYRIVAIQANNGTVTYAGWNITKDADGNLTFTYSA